MDPFFRPVAIALAVAAIFVAITAFSPNSAFRTQGRLKAEVADYQRRNRMLERENRALTQEIEALSGNPTVLERSSRETLGLVRSDEVIFHFQK